MLATLLLSAILNTQTDGYVLFGSNGVIVEDGSFDVEEITALREAYAPNAFWFRSDGRSYIIRDAALLKQVDDLFEPQRSLGRKQEALGEQQAALGRKQAALGARQARAGSEEQLQNELSRQQDELARQQDALARIQNDLAARQNELGHEIHEKLGTMAKEWIRSGVAKPLR